LRSLAKLLSCLSLILFRRRSRLLLTTLATAYNSYSKDARSSQSSNLVPALILAEDRRFYRHGGVDGAAMLRAAWHSLFLGRLMGGSTLEQQLIRTISGDKARTVGRKFREVLLCTLVSRVVPKRDIPGLYLSTAYFGWHMNGLKEACRRLGFAPNNLSLRQAASVVARLKYPEPEYRSEARSLKIASRTEYILQGLAKKRCEGLLQIEARENETLFDF
jgi:membrane peptidoglycan carboxypeptidase